MRRCPNPLGSDLRRHTPARRVIGSTVAAFGGVVTVPMFEGAVLADDRGRGRVAAPWSRYDRLVRTRRTARSWPWPQLGTVASRLGPTQREALLQIAELEPMSVDAKAFTDELQQLLSTLAITLDGRLVSEARPTATEIRDPLVSDAIPGAVALVKYFANVDEVSLEALLGEAWEASVSASGMTPSEQRWWRMDFVTTFVLGMRTLLPAMVHLATKTDEKVAVGRRATKRMESRAVLVELATVWARFAEAGWSEFPKMCKAFFEVAGLEPPSRKQCAAALAEAGDLDRLTDEQLANMRGHYAHVRRKLVERCTTTGQVRLMVTTFAEQAWARAKEMGWPLEGDAATWRSFLATVGEEAATKPRRVRAPRRGTAAKSRKRSGVARRG